MEKVVEVKIFRVGVARTMQGPVPIVLLEDTKERVLPVFVDETQALSIGVALEGATPPVPNTHDFMIIALETLEIKVKKAIIYDLKENRYLARVTLEMAGKEKGIEGRPSDAIALAVRASAPIFVAEKVMGEASISKSELFGPEPRKEDEGGTSLQ